MYYQIGIGSFKLYVMIAHLISNSFASKSSANVDDDLDLYLLEFFKMYGNPQHLNKTTVVKFKSLEVFIFLQKYKFFEVLF